MIFVNSMSDLFHEEVPSDFIHQVFDAIKASPRHTFQILTKRPARMLTLADELPWPANLWMGVSIENRRFVDRANLLRKTPAEVKFISAEPLLGNLEGLNLDAIDWVIAGGESGPGYRPVKVEWLRYVRDLCQAESVPFFFKQWGGTRPKTGGRELDDREWNEMPKTATASAM